MNKLYQDKELEYFWIIVKDDEHWGFFDTGFHKMTLKIFNNQHYLILQYE